MINATMGDLGDVLIARRKSRDVVKFARRVSRLLLPVTGRWAGPLREAARAKDDEDNADVAAQALADAANYVSPEERWLSPQPGDDPNNTLGQEAAAAFASAWAGTIVRDAGRYGSVPDGRCLREMASYLLLLRGRLYWLEMLAGE